MQLFAKKESMAKVGLVPFADSHDHGNLTFVGAFLDGEAVAQA